jgi:SWI/SNF-related matrix-associated actin-dependent regulator of chromatin subfamily A containing DEAD/H box 1
VSLQCLQQFVLDEKTYVEAGKIEALLRLLEQYHAEGRKVLVFSQFTQVLDILQQILQQREIKYQVLTGQTQVDTRQSLVDEFTEDESIEVFLLSTKAGGKDFRWLYRETMLIKYSIGMGINLTAASVVIMYVLLLLQSSVSSLANLVPIHRFDQDFNPHNDRQAQDRAYRIGQKRDVDVIKLIMRGTIEEDMLRLGETKLALDEAVAGEADEHDGESKGESAPEREMRLGLLNSLRQQFQKESVPGPIPGPIDGLKKE